MVGYEVGVSHCLYGSLACKTRRTSTPGSFVTLSSTGPTSRAGAHRNRMDAYVAILVALVQGREEHQVTLVKDFDKCAVLL